MPNFRSTKPRLRLACTTSPVLAPGFQLIPWNVVDYDDVAGYDGAGGYVCDRPGLWLVTAFASRNSTASASQPQVQCRLNGANVSVARGVNRVEGQGVSYSDVIEAAENDVLDLRVILHTTLAVALNDDARWSVTRIGPKSWT